MTRPRHHNPAQRVRRLALPLAAVLALALSAAAHADVGEQIVLRCTHGQSLAGFSQSAYAEALKQLSADTEEYTDCSSLIRQAQLAAAGHGAGSGAAAPVPIAPSPAQQQAIAHAAHARPAPVRVGGQTISPGVVHASIASAFSSLPTPLIATLALLLAVLALVAFGALRNRVRARRSH